VKNANNWEELVLNTKAYDGLVSKAQTHKGVVKLIAHLMSNQEASHVTKVGEFPLEA
jgi:hypothetical protein